MEFTDINNYEDLINSFDYSTSISPDKNGNKEEYKVLKSGFDLKIRGLMEKYDLSMDTAFLSLFLFNMLKFSFSKDILVAYNKQVAGYHFNTDLTVREYLNDFKSQRDGYHDVSGLNFDNEILFTAMDYRKEDYHFIFSYDDENMIIEYDTSFYSDEIIGAFLASMNVLIARFDDEDELLKNISIVENVDLDDDFRVELANEGLINKIFENAVYNNPDECILYADDGEFTYDELNRKANRIANALLKMGLNVEDRVMLMMRRDSDLIASVLGVVKAGGAFIPVDPNYPKHRIDQMLEDSDSRFVITNKDIEYGEDDAVHVSELLKEEDDSNPAVELTPDNLCFLIFTSGSTGKPKGVMITHRGISNYVANHPKNVPIYELNRKCSKFVSISMISFIVFLREIFGTILNGLPVIFTNDEQLVNPLEFYKLFKKYDADAFGATPTRLIEYLSIKEIQEVVNECKVIVVGGEGFPPVLYDRLREFTRADIYNSYGPTEVTIASHYKLVDSSEVTAGWKMLNVVDKIMDIDGNQLPAYVPGEVYVGGAGVARGYINNPEQTEKVFMNINGIAYYNTGDLCKKDEYGELYVIGRNDGQIKLRGLRIEPSEIETLIAKFPNVLITKVMIKKVNATDYLCAYFTATEKIDIEELKESLLANLPEYMLPSFFIQMDEFPKTPNGKTDFKHLPDPKINVEEFIAPSNNIEEAIFEVVAEIMGTRDFGVNTDLFMVGLTSLSVVQLVSAVYERFDIQLMVTDVMKYKSIENIASQINPSVDEVNEVSVDYHELSPNQLGIYFDCLKNPEKLGYNLPKKIVFDRDIDEIKLRDAIIEAINIHPYLKNRIIIRDGKVYNRISKDVQIDEIDIEYVDEVSKEVFDDFIRAFELVDNQLFRFKILTTRDNVVLLADFHHIIVDGNALNILFNNITALYDEDDSRLIVENADAYEYIYDENRFNLSEASRDSEFFYEEMMSDFDECTLLSTNLNDDEKLAKVANIRVGLDKEAVDEFCGDKMISPNILFMSSSVLSLTKYISDNDVLISTIFNGRDNPKYRNTIGMLVKTLPISFKTDRNMCIDDYFESINKSWMNVLNNSSFNYVNVANKYDLYPDFLYAFHGNIVEDVTIGGKTYPRESMEYNSLRFKIALNILEINDEYVISIEYNDALYTQDYIKTFANAIKTLVTKFMENKNKLSALKLRDMALIDEKETNFEEVDIKLLHKLLEKNVKENPEKLALKACDGQLTYDELNRKANRLAHALINRGVKSGSKILYKLPRTSNLIIAMWGIIKTGCAFIPLAYDYPKERIEYIYKNSEADWVISDNNLENAVSVETLLNESDDETNPVIDIKEDNIAYMIYTSGTTGNPKGIMVTNKNITNLFANTTKNYYYNVISDIDRMLNIATVSFDASLLELLGSFANAKTLIFADDTQVKDIFELVDLIKETKPDCLGSTPSRLMQYMEFDGFKEQLHNFKKMFIGGEKLPQELVSMLSEYNVKVYNSYGPTETTIQSNIKHVKENETITVGKALYNYVTDVRDIDAKLLPDGVMGELYIGGNGVSKGYYKNDEKTRESFTTINNIAYYKSGDYAIRQNDEIIVTGRMDNQIKLRGLRIEPEEISSLISKYDNINKSVVVIKKINGVDHLCAYYTSSTTIDIEELKNYLSSKLTAYMIPTAFMQLDKFPQTPNGKTDIKRLPEPTLIREYVAPENDIEAFFAQIFEEVLELEKVGVTDNFFEIGGNSLLVTKITIEAINNNYDINYGDVFDNPTPRKLAKLLSKEEKEENDENEISNYDYTFIDNLLTKNNFKSFNEGKNAKNLGNVLITGTTGFLGIHVLKDFIDNEEGDVYCLVRSKGTITAKDRLQSLFFYYFSDDYEDDFKNRIHVIDGDITSPDDFKKLIPYNINTIINCAALVKHFSTGTEIEDINVGGVKNAIEFAKTKECKFIQISTVSVAGESVNNYPPSTRIFGEDDLYIGQRVDNKYINSKFLAERCVLEAAVKDKLDVKIMRVGNLMARSSDSEFQINFNSNGFINRLKAFVTVGKFPYNMLNNNVEFSPIDTTARSIIELSKTPQECRVFHTLNNHKVSFSDVLNIIKSLGYDIEIVTQEEFDEAINEIMKDENKREGISGFITSIGSGQVKKIWVQDKCDYTMQVSYMLNVEWPLISYDYIYNFIKYLKEMNFFD